MMEGISEIMTLKKGKPSICKMAGLIWGLYTFLKEEKI